MRFSGVVLPISVAEGGFTRLLASFIEQREWFGATFGGARLLAVGAFGHLIASDDLRPSQAKPRNFDGLAHAGIE